MRSTKHQTYRGVRWRALFDALRVSWRDRGANTSRGHINIRCPWCGNSDPSHHLTINEESGAYRCYRDPQLHAGWSLPWLLLALGASSREVDGLLQEFMGGAPEHSTLQATPAAPIEWDKHKMAWLDANALAYMRERGYSAPEAVCREFDLRFDRTGRMAWRILFPLDAGGETLGVIGRAIRASMEPRYLTNDPYGGCIYMPRRVEHTQVLLLSEGTLDVLPVALAMAPEEVLGVAILGTDIPDARKLTLDLLARRAARVVYVPDADQAASTTYRLIKELELLPHISHVERIPPVAGRKDLGTWAAHIKELRAWIESVLGLPRAGMAPASPTPAPLSAAMPGGSPHT